tara:strand:- start:4770 stop:5000 length:231 start_codon:yes stop_codon:yes gene_type:complete
MKPNHGQIWPLEQKESIEFEELSGDIATLGMRMLLRRVLSVEKQKQRSELEIDFSAQLESAVIYRMRMQKMTGRFE